MKLLLTTIKTDCRQTDNYMRYLYSIVDDSPIEVTMKTYGKYQLISRIYEDIVMGHYNIVYFQCDELNTDKISQVAEMVKKAVPSTAVIAGGMQVSFDTERFMRRNPWFDFVLRGETEPVLYDFLQSIYGYTFDYEQIPGLAYRIEDRITVNDIGEPLEVEDLPFPYDKTELSGDIVYYETMRGTSDPAYYTPRYPESTVRSLSLNRVCRELRYFLVKEVKRVVILDRYFNHNPERAYRVFEYLINNDNGVTTFEFDIDGENLDEETVRLLGHARDGLLVFNIDVGSTNAEVLSASGRKENIYQLMYNVTKMLQGGRVLTKIRITAGLPLESEELFRRSFNKAFGLGEGSPLKIDFLRLGKGTELRNQADKYGYLYTEASPYDVIGNDHLQATEMIRIREVSRIVSAYIGNGGFKASFPRLLSDTGLRPYDVFSMLTDYVGGNEFFKKLNKPENLARILHSWAETLYADFEDNSKFEMLTQAIHADLEAELPEEDVIKFDRDGWEI